MPPLVNPSSEPVRQTSDAASAAEKPDVSKGRCPSIQAVNLTKIFGDRISVDHLNFTVYEGELYALLGDNGAGKTTTINMLTTLLKPTSGEFFVCGVNGVSKSEKTKGTFGVVSQDIAIYQELTAYENLSFIADLYGIKKATARAKIGLLLEEAGLIDRAHDLVGSFSHGMQRKLTIAGALVHGPQVLFMDEPTVGLDPGSRRHIWSSLKALKQQGVTILLTTHYLEEAELLADRIGIIHYGRLVAEGKIEDLRDKIRGMRSIAIRLAHDLDESELAQKLALLQEQFPVEVRRDLLRNTISFSQPKNKALVNSLHQILTWLEEQNIPFSRFSTNEPNLEEVFLAVMAEQEGLDEQALRITEYKRNSDSEK